MWSGIRLVAAGVLTTAVTALPMLSGVTTVSAQQGGRALVGTFRLTPGTCQGGPVKGSTFRMVLPSGNAGGPFVSNNDSACGDRTYTLIAPGTDGGLVTGSYQPEPNPAFDGNGNSLARRITTPARFYGVSFSTSTNPTDPQTRVAVPAPSVVLQPDGKLTGDLRAFGASWNHQEFNQGGPKPDGSTPGNTTAPSGTYDPATGAFTLNWASQIQGGPFDRFTGLWHLEGTFVPAAATGGPATTTPSAPPTTTRGGGTGGGSSDDDEDDDGPAGATGTATTAATTAPGATVAGESETAPGTTEEPSGSDDTGSSSAAGPVVDTDDGEDDVPAWLVVLAALLAVATAGGAVAFTRTRRTS